MFALFAEALQLLTAQSVPGQSHQVSTPSGHGRTRRAVSLRLVEVRHESSLGHHTIHARLHAHSAAESSCAPARDKFSVKLHGRTGFWDIGTQVFVCYFL